MGYKKIKRSRHGSITEGSQHSKGKKQYPPPNEPTKEDEPFNVSTFAKRHMRVGAWVNERTQVYTSKELKTVSKMALEVFKKEPMLATLQPPCTIVGDIHGQYRDLIRILSTGNREEDRKKKIYNFSRHNFMFLGDYVDRGTHSVESICLVFSLKVLFPSQYKLLRGNHETKAINFAYGFREELISKLGPREGIEAWECFNDTFAWMPVAGIIGKRILCMHGGISPHLSKLDDIRKIKRPLPNASEVSLALDLLWSDPADEHGGENLEPVPLFKKNIVRGLSCTFNTAAVKEMCRRLDIKLIVRAHQVMDGGFKFHSDRKLVTIFSAPRYMQETDNKGAVINVARDGGISFKIYAGTINEKKAEALGQEENEEPTKCSDTDSTKTAKEPKAPKEPKEAKSTSIPASSTQSSTKSLEKSS